MYFKIKNPLFISFFEIFSTEGLLAQFLHIKKRAVPALTSEQLYNINSFGARCTVF